jgi:hypothetical protein
VVLNSQIFRDVGRKGFGQSEKFFRDRVLFFTLIPQVKDEEHCSTPPPKKIGNGRDILELGKAHFLEGKKKPGLDPSRSVKSF